MQKKSSKLKIARKIAPRIASKWQFSGCLTNFSIEFKTFASILQLDEGNIISEYKEKLKDTVQQGIVYTTGITSFELLIAKSIKIDQVLYKIAKASTKKDESRT